MPTYTYNKHHRNKNPKKTQWHKAISVATEQSIWQNGHDEQWRENNSVFGVYIQNDKPTYLDDKVSLNFARFKGDHQDDWHGWPANPVKAKNDLPPSEVFQAWVEKGYTDRCRAKKVRGLQECSI